MNDSKSLLILGAGQYGQVTREVALAQGGFARIDFLDDYNSTAIGKLADFDKFGHDCAVVALGNPHEREFWVERIQQSNTLTMPSLIHPKAVVMPSAHIGSGSIIEAGAVICSNSRIGTACIIQANAVIGHDATVSDFCKISYNATVFERFTTKRYDSYS